MEQVEKFSILLRSFYGIVSFLCLFDCFVSFCRNFGISICKEKVRCIFVLSLACSVYLPFLIKNEFLLESAHDSGSEEMSDDLQQVVSNLGSGFFHESFLC